MPFDAQHIEWDRIEGATIDFGRKEGQSIPVTATSAPQLPEATTAPRTITFGLPGASPATLTCMPQPGTAQ